MSENKFIEKATIEVPSISKLGGLYQRAIEKDHKTTALSAEQAVLTLGRAEASMTEARVIASFLDEV